MAVHKQLFALATALASALRLIPAGACSCLPLGHLCEYVQEADVVLRAVALSRSEGADINDDAVYEVRSVEVFKAEDDTAVSQEYAEGATFNVTTAGNGALCGIYMTIDGEYLLDLDRRQDTEADGGSELRSRGSCGLTNAWGTVTSSDEDVATLEEGCDDFDPCEGECGEYQECLKLYNYYSVEYYCADTCDPSPCSDEETCNLTYEESCGTTEELCPPVATCTSDACTSSPCGDEDGTDATPSPNLGRDIALTLPPGNYVDSSSSSSYAPSASSLGVDIVQTVPPGNYVDSSSSSASSSPSTLSRGGDSDQTSSPSDSGAITSVSSAAEGELNDDTAAETSAPSLVPQTEAPVAPRNVTGEDVDTDGSGSSSGAAAALLAGGWWGTISGVSVAGALGAAIFSRWALR